MILKNCPRCGGKRMVMSFRAYAPRWKVACEYCKFLPEKPAWTQKGAKRIWNRETCTRIDGKKVRR